jgi:lytic cellulose monooxygenase (C1-hydroxylating)
LLAEVIAHHESNTRFTQNRNRGAQFYPSCVQIRVTSSGSKKLPGGATFPGTYTDAEPGIHFDLYTASAASYKAPGPSVWSEATGGSIGRVAIPGQGPVATQPLPSPVQTTAIPTVPSSSPSPSPEVPAPEIPTPEVPAPQVPAPEVPAPEVPAPEVPAPEVPAPEVPAPEVPAPEVPPPQSGAAELYAQCGGVRGSLVVPRFLLTA